MVPLKGFYKRFCFCRNITHSFPIIAIREENCPYIRIFESYGTALNISTASITILSFTTFLTIVPFTKIPVGWISESNRGYQTITFFI